MYKLTAKSLKTSLDIYVEFETQEEAEKFAQLAVKDDHWGKPLRVIKQDSKLLKPEGAVLLRTEITQNELGETEEIAHYELPCEYEYEITFDESIAKKKKRQDRILKGKVKAQKCEDAINYMIDANSDLTKEQVDIMLSTFSNIHMALQAKRIDTARILIEAIVQEDMNEIKEDLLEILNG